MTLKQTVSTTGDLPGSGNEQGDLRIVDANLVLWAWNGISWYSIGPAILGYTGSQGTPGDPGLRGYSGSVGDVGYAGSQGDIGYAGSQGDVGYAGSEGYTGSVGYAGSQGEIGYTGSRPDTGNIIVNDSTFSTVDSSSIVFDQRVTFNSAIAVEKTILLSEAIITANQNSNKILLIDNVTQKRITLGTPSTPIGSVNDQEGNLFWDDSYLYVCVADYDGVTNIWKRINWSTDQWN